MEWLKEYAYIAPFVGLVLAAIGIISTITFGFLNLNNKEIDRKEVLLKTPGGRTRIKAELNGARDYYAWYQTKIIQFNAGLDGFYGPNLWGNVAAIRCMQIAFIYPFAAFLVAWLFGASGSIGNLTLMPEMGAWYDRAWRFAFVLVSLPFAFFLLLNFKSTGKAIERFVKRFLHKYLSFLNASFKRAITTLSSFIAFIFVVVIAIAIAIATTPSIRTDAFHGEYPTQIVILFTFLITLPFANALWDYASLDATRFFLRKIERMQRGLHGFMWIFWHIVADFAIALLCLIGLVVVMVVCLELSNKAFIALKFPVVEWRLLLAQNQQTAWGLFSLYAMLFTTILPTILHIFSGFVGLIMAFMPENTQITAQITDSIEADGNLTQVAMFYVRRMYIARVVGLLLTLALASGVYFGLDALFNFGEHLHALALWTGGLF